MSSPCYWQNVLSFTTRSWACYEMTNFGDLCPGTMTTKNYEGLRETAILTALWRSPPDCLYPWDNNHIWLSKVPKQALSFELSVWELGQVIGRITQKQSVPGVFRVLSKAGYPQVFRNFELHACLPFLSSKCFCHLRPMPNQTRILGLYQLGMERFLLDINFH